MGLSIFFGSVALMWLALAVSTLRGVLAVKSLPPQSEVGPGRAPRVSVVIPARDEQARIETTVRRLLSQTGVELEVIAVDDRSTDRTSEILHSAAAEDPRLSVLRVDALPEGWLGKCYACHLGGQNATGEWLLFTDGDIWMKPDVIARAVGAALAERVDHVCLIFGMSHGTLAGRACHLIATMSLSRQAARLDRARPRGYMGIGAFNLVRTAAYREAGGHVPLRLTVCDDWMLGLLLRRAGRSTRAFLAGGDVEADWFATPLGMVRALEKNYFAARDYRIGRVLVGAVLFLLLWTSGVVGPWTGAVAGVFAGLAMLSVTVPAAVLAPRLRLPRRAALLVPFVFPVLVLVMFNSAVRTLRQGGIRWRDTFYPLDLLRAGNYR
jgi:glycosyltransferase involved in cell wall biosynthesis